MELLCSQWYIQHLETNYAEYLQSIDGILTKFAAEMASEGIAYCSKQIIEENVLEPVLTRSVTDSLARATEFLTFIPEKSC
jgi:hypothetical protein